jgi:hypothetical protein
MNTSENEIDLMELAKKLWKNGLVIALSISKKILQFYWVRCTWQIASGLYGYSTVGSAFKTFESEECAYFSRICFSRFVGDEWIYVHDYLIK